MSSRPILRFGAEEVAALAGSALREALLADAERAATRLWASVFLVGLVPRPQPTVRAVLDAFVRASRRGVDVRLLVDDFRSGPEQVRANAVAARYLTARGVDVRVYEGKSRSGGADRASHSKYLVVDESAVIVGSANLTPGGLDDNAELSLRVRSPDLARELARRFELGWAEGTPPESAP